MGWGGAGWDGVGLGWEIFRKKMKSHRNTMDKQR